MTQTGHVVTLIVFIMKPVITVEDSQYSEDGDHNSNSNRSLHDLLRMRFLPYGLDECAHYVYAMISFQRTCRVDRPKLYAQV